jgi:N-acetylmuramoyl-L-alanine amidase
MSTSVALVPATGEDILQLATQHLGEKYVLGVLVPKDNNVWKGPWDCSEFASWVTYQAAAKLYGCDRDYGDPSTADAFTGYWERDAKTLGQIINLDQAAQTTGAFVLRIPAPGATGHIVISDGNGGTVEAHSSGDGVVALSLANRRWDMGILVPGIQYMRGTASLVAAPAGVIYRLTSPMMKGDQVAKIQGALQSVGISPGAIDGEFGPHTSSAVVAFQLKNNLVPDGEVGPATAKALGVQL